MQSNSVSAGWVEEINPAPGVLMSHGFTPTLAVVVTSVKQDRKAVTELLSKNDRDVLGTTSCGEFVSYQQRQGETP